MSKFVIYLVGTGRAPTVKFCGESGKAYTFRWHDTHRAMILEGRELTGEEFAKCAHDIFAASLDQNISRPVPLVIAGSSSSTESGFAVPRFDTNRELLRVCRMLGQASEENARLTKALEGKHFDLATPPKAIEAPAPSPASAGEFADFDPDEALDAQAPPMPVAEAAPAPPKPVPQMMPTRDPRPGLHGGDFDPDELPADLTAVLP